MEAHFGAQIDLARTGGRRRQSRTVHRGMPVWRAIAQSLMPAAMSRCATTGIVRDAIYATMVPRTWARPAQSCAGSMPSAPWPVMKWSVHAAPRRVSGTASCAAAAQAAGFRSCLRCHPETAPETAAWKGTETTVSRALHLIADGSLDDDDVEGLAGRLGVSGRHLRRLFEEHLGTSPIVVAHTRRLLFAKQLLGETNLAVSAVALAAGFNSVRRFNTVIQATYGRAPRELRGKGTSSEITL